MLRHSKMKWLVFVSAFACLLASLSVGGCAAPSSPGASEGDGATVPSEVYEWRFQSIMAAGPDSVERYQHQWIDVVEEMTDGRIKMTLYHGGDVVPVEEQFSAISKGIIEMGFSLGSYWTGIHPAFQVEGGMPMSFANPRAFLDFMYDYGFIDYMRDICSEQGVYYLDAHTSGAITMMTKKKLSSLDDLKGFKVRAFGSYLDLMEKLNAAPVYLPMPEISTGLSTGTIEGVITGPDVLMRTNVWEVCPYIVQPDLIGCCPQHLLMNLEAWESLPSDLQHILELCAMRLTEYHERVWSYQQTLFIPQMVEECGCEISKLPDEDWEKVVAAGTELWDGWANENPDAREAVDMMKDYFRQIGYIK